ncbi:DUF4384 domain-containing protein (plasmid) [Leisingera sp. S132]|uniref:DUF4384 domain-containing protein n=1 Tax=Leisingera sp. S132 TaxID=2867016 RepID=UPI0021A77381|nr:DUF4384 domain-containing protein [Leisingera sp. S132]UWQ81379.1 DUF4384 domain-containing protein [Leisingera sp. S132]
MTRAPAIWALGLSASALVHAAGAGALLISLTPDPLPQQPTPESSLNLQAHRIPRSEAVPQTAESEQASESKGQTQGLAAGSIPQSRAQPTAPAADSLKPAAAKTSAAAPARAPAGRLASAAAPLTPAPAAQPDTAALPQTAPASQPGPQAQPQAVPLPGAAPAPQQTPAAVPDAPRIKAALAFQGGSGDIDPVSLAAFQSFMQPGDAAAEGDPLRDGVSGILAAVPCARLQVAFVPGTATLEVRGHLPEDGLRSPVLAALQAQMGTDITVSDQMRLLPRPQCGALAGISNVGLPQSTDQITNPLLVGSDAHARVLDYSGGERLFFDLTAPDYPAFVYVDYFDAGGAVLHLSPNELVPLAEAAPKTALRVGAKAAGDPGLQITVAPPYGQEIAVAFAASHPLYDGLRPLSEPAEPYLDFLRAQVAAARAEHADFKGEWVYFLITTHAP